MEPVGCECVILTYQVRVCETNVFAHSNCHQHVAAADAPCRLIKVLHARVGLEFPHGGLRQNVATAAVVEITVLRRLEAAKEVVLLGVERLQHLDHVRPVDICVSVDVDVPVVVRAYAVGHV